MAARPDEIAEDVADSSADCPAGEILAGRWALGLGSALVILLAGAEAAHWQTMSQVARFEEVVQQSVPISSPSSHPDVSAPDPGDNP
jgi:hypothetical protein